MAGMTTGEVHPTTIQEGTLMQWVKEKQEAKEGTEEAGKGGPKGYFGNFGKGGKGKAPSLSGSSH